MNLIIHRGTKEIGGTLIELFTDKTRIILDIGLPLVETNTHPTVKGLYKNDSSTRKVDGVFISHPHMDHYGLLEQVREDVDVYVGDDAKKLINLTGRFTHLNGTIKNHISLKSGCPLTVGDFTVTPFLMDHSGYDSYAFLIETGGKKVIYSGDFREHGRKAKTFYYFLYRVPKYVDALLIEGTMLGRSQERVKTESQLEDDIYRILTCAKKLVMAHLSSQNIDRVVTMFRAARKAKRTFVVDIYTAYILSQLQNTSIPQPSSQYPDVLVYYPRRLCDLMAKKGDRHILYRFKHFQIKREEINANPGKYLLMIRPSMMYDLQQLHTEGATLIYSLWSGYLDDPATKKMISYLLTKGGTAHHVHTSGHATINTIKKVIKSTNPKVIIPIHTDRPQFFTGMVTHVKLLDDGEIYSV